MSLPILIIFERHWDKIPKYLVRDLQPVLSELGYNTLCVEAPKDWSSTEIRATYNSNLEFSSKLLSEAEALLRQVGIIQKLSKISYARLNELLRLYVSSQKYEKLARRIKELPAYRLLKMIFEDPHRLSVQLQGIDIDAEDWLKMTRGNIDSQMERLDAHESYRINTMFECLLQLREKQAGVIYLCGALHASNLMAKFAKKNIENEVLYYFPHSRKRYDDSIDDINDVLMNETLQGHTYLLAKEEVCSFKERIVTEIVQKIYKEVEGGNTISRFLNGFFGLNFRAFLRPGYHVDALVEIDEVASITALESELAAQKIQRRQLSMGQRRYLVIPGVNTLTIAEKIKDLCLQTAKV